jgi:hypothetical protein
VGSTYFLIVAGQIPSGFSRAVQEQFEDVQIAAGRSRTVIECSVSDQSALRALLTLLWDVRCELLLVSRIDTENPRSHDGHCH